MDYELTEEMNEKDFGHYYYSKLVHKWRNNYFHYAEIKDQISQRYKKMVDGLNRQQGKKGGKIKLDYFGDDQNYKSFIQGVDNLIMEEISKVRKFHSFKKKVRRVLYSNRDQYVEQYL